MDAQTLLQELEDLIDAKIDARLAQSPSNRVDAAFYLDLRRSALMDTLIELLRKE
jgi:hypothetical protein